MLEKLHDIVTSIDYTVWYYVNTLWHNEFLDTVVPYIRNQWTWVPLYLFLLVFMLKNYGYTGLAWCLFFVGTFAISDQLSAHLLKEIFQRTRPCNNPQLAGLCRLLVPRSSGYSFPSSHAANHFSLGVFMAITLHRRIKWIWYPAMFWAASVSYAQVYVGVHFPVDVFVGGVLGACVGIFTAKLFHWKLTLAAKPVEVATEE